MTKRWMPADPAYGWGNDDQGWFLVDRATKKQYRSPMDSGEAKDYAYIGRLPRPDGDGTFLNFGGIHAVGTLGAAHWLADNLDKVYREARGKRWSVVIEVHYDRDRRITKTDRLAPLVRHDGAGK